MKKIILLTTVVVAILSFALTSQANEVTFNLYSEFSGSWTPAYDDPTLNDPWLRAVFDDGGSPGTVTLTMTAPGLSYDPDSEPPYYEFVSGWYFNFQGDASSLGFELTSGVAAASVNHTDQYKADGDGYYDILFSFPTAGSNLDLRFMIDDTSVWTITGTGITANSFNVGSSSGGGEGSFLSAAHIQSSIEGSSAWATVPIPGTVWIFGAGLIGLVGIRRKIRN